ncbi:MAG: YqaE/Pmp3 family membrane protein [Bacteroidetes bacterium]|nr:YqaE/Pmp3 family membrane protein [Bacteroidota bacterium]
MFTRLVLCFLAAVLIISPAIAASASQPVPVTDSTTHPGQPDKAAIDAALSEFKSLSRKERRARIRESKKWIKEYRAEKKAGKSKKETDQVLLIILCILLPPLAVYLKEDEINGKFWLSILLTLLFWLPGVIYALLVVFDEV